MLSRLKWALSGVLAAGLLGLGVGCGGGFDDGAQNPDDLDGVSLKAAALSDEAVSAVAVRLAWAVPDGYPTAATARAGYVIGYEIYRDTLPISAGTPDRLIAFLEGGSSTSYIDSANEPITSESVTLETDSTTGIVRVTRAAGSGVAAITYGVETVVYDIEAVAPSPGQAYYYAVRPVAKKLGATPFDPTDGDVDLSGQIDVTFTLRQSGVVTLTPGGALVSPPNDPDPGSMDVDLSSHLFQWSPALGADTYVLELCTDRSFPAEQVVRSSEYHISDAATADIARVFAGADAATAFANWDGLIYWRVGARCSTDTFLPVNRFGDAVGYVYSDYRAFSALESAPPQP